jgi:competence protein ComEC
MAKKSVVFLCALSFLAGNASTSFFVISSTLILISGGVACLLTGLFKRSWLPIVVALILGILSWQLRANIHTPTPESDRIITGGEIVFVESKINKQLVTVRLQTSALSGYKVLLYADRYPEYSPGQQLDFSCRLERPEPIEEFRYDRYLALSRIYYICYRPSSLRLGDSVSWRYWLFQIKRFYSSSYNRYLPEPEGNVTRAMLLAERKELPSDLTTQFSRAGLSHVMAISGMNMTLLVGALQAVAVACSWRRSFTFGLVVTILILYVTIIGFQASAVRAAVMAGLVLLSQVVHRQYDPWYVLIVVAAGLTALNPLSLMYDIGWQLSFLAMAGLLFWQKRFEQWLGFLPEAFGCRAIAATSLSAQVFTFPLMLYYFQTFSTIFLVTNILALPAVDIVTVGALAAPLIWWLPGIGWGVTLSSASRNCFGSSRRNQAVAKRFLMLSKNKLSASGFSPTVSGP